MNNFEPKIVIFRCNFCSPAGARIDPSKLKGDAHLRLIETTCTGRIDPTFILDAFTKGADGVLVAGCLPGDCHYISGNYKARRNMMLLQNMLSQLGVEPQRLRTGWFSTCETPKALSTLDEFIGEVTKLGPLTVN